MENSKILDAINKERFRRRLLISSRILAILLILSIFFIGFVQINYVKEINNIKAEYGPQAYCYLCGLESGKTCTCNYLSKLVVNGVLEEDFSIKEYLQNIAFTNTEICIEEISLSNNKNKINKLNISQ